jgi:ferredoxin-NADP reductase
MSGCIKGYIDKGLLAAEIKDMAQRLFFVFGPPQMVEEMKNLCTGMGCKKDNLHTESFLGY